MNFVSGMTIQKCRITYAKIACTHCLYKDNQTRPRHGIQINKRTDIYFFRKWPFSVGDKPLETAARGPVSHGLKTNHFDLVTYKGVCGSVEVYKIRKKNDPKEEIYF